MDIATIKLNQARADSVKSAYVHKGLGGKTIIYKMRINVQFFIDPLPKSTTNLTHVGPLFLLILLIERARESERKSYKRYNYIEKR